MNSPRLWSVLDIMRRFNFPAFIDIYNNIHAAQIAADKMRSSFGAHPQVDCAEFVPLCDKIIAFGNSCGFKTYCPQRPSVEGSHGDQP